MSTNTHHSPKKPRSIYRSQSDEIREVFDSAQSLEKVLIVALDFAKETHLALICDATGNQLKEAFPVHNSKAGVEFLIKQINASARRRKIPKSQILLGGEDVPNYVHNFLSALLQKKFTVVSVNAWRAKKNRENVLATTDKLDLLGIASTMILRQASVIRSVDGEQAKTTSEIRDLCRRRRTMIHHQTAVSNQIHSLVDILLPGFLCSTKSGISPFTKTSLALMKERFSGPQIARRKLESLANTMRGNRVKDPTGSAAKLIALAKEVLPPDSAKVNSLQVSLTCSINLFECLKENGEHLKIEAAKHLARTPYAMLTSIRGIGLILAAGTAAELGDPARMKRLDSLCGYAGVVPQVFQTGGPDKAAHMGPTSSRCNHYLKDWVVQASKKIRMYGPPEIKDRYARWDVNGQHADFAGARRYLRLVRCLVKNAIPYLSPEARQAGASDEVMAAACEEAFEVITHTWQTVPGWPEIVFAEDRPLGFWRRLAIETYGAHLPLPGED